MAGPINNKQFKSEKGLWWRVTIEEGFWEDGAFKVISSEQRNITFTTELSELPVTELGHHAGLIAKEIVKAKTLAEKAIQI